MANFGFVTECDQCVGAVLDARGDTLDRLLYVNPSETVRKAIERMREHGISQLPVCKNTPPFAAAEVAGSVDELELMERIADDPAALELPVDEVMSPPLPTIGIGQKIEHALDLLHSAPALLVLSGGRPLSVLSRTDILAYFEQVATATDPEVTRG
jgi:cystathionine beta-synthase